MGLSVLSRMCKKKEVRILINGLDSSGKTSLLYKMKLGTVVTTIPTIGFNVETVQYKNLYMTVWDIGGRDKMRPLIRHYYPNTNAFIFMVDSNDHERLEYAVDEFHKALAEDALDSIPFAIVANKQDLPSAMSVEAINEAFKVSAIHSHKVKVFGTSTITGDGLQEMLEWVSEQLTYQQTTNAIIQPLKNALPTSFMNFSVTDVMKTAVGYMKGMFSSSP